MADHSIYVDVIAKALEDDSTLNLLVDGQIVPGFQRVMADDYLKKPNKTCIGVRSYEQSSTPLPGCAYHGISDHEFLIEFHLIQIATNDGYLAGVENQIQKIMKRSITKNMNGIDYSFSTVGKISFHPFNDDQFLDRVEIIGTCKIEFWDE